jgi:hypothetical protein
MIWIVGQMKGRIRAGTAAWEFQGVFSSEEKARAACRRDNYFYAGPYTLNESLPHATRDVAVAFPRAHNKKTY